ncbi:hypothetical protein H5410_056610 [Solanum commersonii]|uniref:Uncharacterized protein n=1 Tax=Solanum commersonii TaxID=4109 RepID=A0A9J5WMR8_SOLCO|nr:hypothetical protein H5410_056610 [Solanum commersonii]
MHFTDSSKFAIPFPTLSFKCQKHVIISRNVKLGSRILPALKSSDQEMENEGSSEIANDPSTSFLSLLCPLLKLFSEATSMLSTLARLPWGSRVQYGTLGSKDGTKVNPPMHLQIFEFEACPFCRRVREAMTELDLSAAKAYDKYRGKSCGMPGGKRCIVAYIRAIKDMSGGAKMWLSTTKTEYVEFEFSDARHEVGVEVRFDTRNIPKSDRFKYLGSIIQGRGDIDDDITHRIGVAWMK